jgi:hypothetical protein
MSFASWVDYFCNHDGVDELNQDISSIGDRFSHNSEPVNNLKGKELTLFLRISAMSTCETERNICASALSLINYNEDDTFRFFQINAQLIPTRVGGEWEGSHCFLSSSFIVRPLKLVTTVHPEMNDP